LGYVTGLGLLFQASLLFIGLIVFLLVQPILTTGAFSLVDIVVVFVMMGLICFVPFALYVRGVGSSVKRQLEIPMPRSQRGELDEEICRRNNVTLARSSVGGGHL
jgi:hypothetical protein